MTQEVIYHENAYERGEFGIGASKDYEHSRRSFAPKNDSRNFEKDNPMIQVSGALQGFDGWMNGL